MKSSILIPLSFYSLSRSQEVNSIKLAVTAHVCSPMWPTNKVSLKLAVKFEETSLALLTCFRSLTLGSDYCLWYRTTSNA